MEYKVSNISGKWYNDNNIEVSLDTNTEEGKNIDLWLKLGNEPLFFKGTNEEILNLKNEKIEKLKKEQHEELLPTDWYYTRYIETGEEVPLEIKNIRLDIREKYNNLINNINNE